LIYTTGSFDNFERHMVVMW